MSKPIKISQKMYEIQLLIILLKVNINSMEKCCKSYKPPKHQL